MIPLWIRVKPIEEEDADHVVGADYVRDDVAEVARGELKDVAIALGTDDQNLLDHRYHLKHDYSTERGGMSSPEAPEALRAAQQELLKTADQITDPSLRTSFLNIPLHRQILTELARA